MRAIQGPVQQNTAVRVAGISRAIGTSGCLFNVLRGDQGLSKETSGESDSL